MRADRKEGSPSLGRVVSKVGGKGGSREGPWGMKESKESDRIGKDLWESKVKKRKKGVK